MEENLVTPIDVWLDMETGDPDDCLTLLLLIQHSRVNLHGVSIYPGDRQQVGFVKGLISKYSSKKLPIGSYNYKDEKNHLGPNNIKLFGANLTWGPSNPDDEAHILIAKYLAEYPNGTMVTGGPLGNLYVLLKEHPQIQMNQIFVQGGFAGAECVPLENQLLKFKGKTTCPTFNFSGHVNGANSLLSTPNILKKHLISKDVCHGVSWDYHFHKMVLHFRKNSSEIWNIMINAMESYMKKRKEKCYTTH